jgi:hypothetical protein
MRTLLLIPVLTAMTIHGEESGALRMREKMHARIAESVPPLKVTPDLMEGDEAESAVVFIEPMVVSESKVVPGLAATIARKKQAIEDERFSAVKGGTIYGSIGTSWSPEKGWVFLKF